VRASGVVGVGKRRCRRQTSAAAQNVWPREDWSSIPVARTLEPAQILRVPPAALLGRLGGVRGPRGEERLGRVELGLQLDEVDELALSRRLLLLLLQVRDSLHCRDSRAGVEEGEENLVSTI